MNNSVFGKTMKILEKHRDMDADSFIIHITNCCRWCWKKFWYIKLRSWYTLSTGKNKKLVGLMKDEFGGKIMTKFVALIPKTYSYLMDVGNSDKKEKRTKKVVIKQILKFNDYKNCLLYNEIT